MSKNIFWLSLSLFFLTANLYGQATGTKTVRVTQSPKTVPPGKKWILETNKEVKVQFSSLLHQSGSRCNALFLSNPRMVMSIRKGDLFKSEGFMVLFKDAEKVPYTNDITYTLTPIAFVDKDFSVAEFQYKKPEEVGVKKLVFNSGEKAFVWDCLESIEMIEVDMTMQELVEERKKQSELKRTEMSKLKNFSIPISPETRPATGIKPPLKDSLIDYVVFESPSVVFRTRNGRGGLDDVHKWVLTLTQNTFEMKSGTFDETYDVLGANYDEQLQMQEFQLADQAGKLTHKLHLGYRKSMESYAVLMGSLDNKDDYQFQQVAIKEIKYRNKQSPEIITPKVVGINVNNEDAVNRIAYTFITEKQYDSAAYYLKLNISKHPNSANCYDSYGEELMNEGKTEEAIKNYEKSVALAKNSNQNEILKNSYQALVKLYLKNGDEKKANEIQKLLDE